MKQNERALLQERVRTLVLTHAIQAALARVIELSGPEAGDELLRLEQRIVAVARAIAAKPSAMSLSTMVAVEDALAAIREAFDSGHRRLDRAGAAAPAPGIVPLAA